jgi:hypothetical protein
VSYDMHVLVRKTMLQTLGGTRCRLVASHFESSSSPRDGFRVVFSEFGRADGHTIESLKA